MTAAVDLWGRVLSAVSPADIDAVRVICAQAEGRRKVATYNTGTIGLASAVLLRAVTSRLRPETAAEIGTFIGTSTFSIVADRVYTCDKNNACVGSTHTVVAFPKTRSTVMLRKMREKGIPVDFWFLDGRIEPDDVAFIRELSSPAAVFALDDYTIGVRRAGDPDKGILNAEILQPLFPLHQLYPPPDHVLGLGQTSIALLAPEGVL